MRPVRVLVADDSATMRAVLVDLLSREPGLQVVGEACDGREAVDRAVALRPDVITLDLRMPRLDGLTAITEIMARAPSRILVIASVDEQEQVDLSLRAVALGALELIAKPRIGEVRSWSRRVAEAVRLMADIPVVTRRPREPMVPAPAGGQRTAAIGLAASTGGPPVLARVLAGLPRGFPIPLLIAQHMSPGFMDGLLRWFSESTALRVVLAREGDEPRPGHAYLPPDEHDLWVDAGRLRVGASEGGPCPNADRLLTSLAESYGPRAAGAVLTGMGRDGALGLLAIRRAGGQTWAQSAQSAVVFGMPAAAVEVGASDRLVDVDGLVLALRGLAAPEPRTD